MTHARRQDRSRFCRRAHFIFQRGSRVAQVPPLDPAGLHPVCLPGLRTEGRCAGCACRRQRRGPDARSGEAGARYAFRRQEARPNHRDAARGRQRLAAIASRGGRAEIRDTAHGGQSWRAAPAFGVRAGRRDLARGRRHSAHADALSGVLLVVPAHRPRSVSLSSIVRYRVEAGAGVHLRSCRRVAGVPPHQAAGGASGSAASANRACPGADAADRRSAIVGR